MQCVRDRYPALFSPAKNTILMCLVPLKMLLMMHQPHLHQPWRLDRCNLLIMLDTYVCI